MLGTRTKRMKLFGLFMYKDIRDFKQRGQERQRRRLRKITFLVSTQSSAKFVRILGKVTASRIFLDLRFF